LTTAAGTWDSISQILELDLSAFQNREHQGEHARRHANRADHSADQVVEDASPRFADGRRVQDPRSQIKTGIMTQSKRELKNE